MNYKAVLFSLALLTVTTPALANDTVNMELNTADLVGISGGACLAIGGAIMAANNPDTFGPTSDALKAEVRTWAKRCKLRF